MSVYRVHVVAACLEGVIVRDPARHEPRRTSLAGYRAGYGGFAVVAE